MNLDPAHAAFPMAVMHRLLACYYGDGPRNNGSVPGNEHVPSDTEPTSTSPTGGVDVQAGSEGEFFNANIVAQVASMPGWTPKGWGTTVKPTPVTPPPA